MKDLSNENIVHIVDGDIEYIQFRKLLEYKDKLAHGFSIKPLNFKNKAKESEDYAKFCKAISVDNTKIVQPQQVHSCTVGIPKFNSKSSDFQNTDGLITNYKNIPICCLAADCIALMFYDPIKNVIANVHSGWRGTIGKIGKLAVDKMHMEYGCNPSDIICCIGPSIHKCSFVVEEDVKELYENNFKSKDIIEKGPVVDGVQKYYIDSVLANKELLIDCGLKDENIIDSGICTVCNEDKFHSYRAHKNDAGRNLSIMCLL